MFLINPLYNYVYGVINGTEVKRDFASNDTIS